MLFVTLVGQIKKPWPPDGNKLIRTPGSNVKIRWKFQVSDISKVKFRIWYFTSSDGRFNDEELAKIVEDEEPEILTTHLTGVGVEEQATLVLKNVNQTYDGEYVFSLTAGSANSGLSKVTLIIAGIFFCLLHFTICIFLLKPVGVLLHFSNTYCEHQLF